MLSCFNRYFKNQKTQQIRKFVADLDSVLPPTLANIVLQYLDTSQIEFHVTRHIVLAHPILSFRHIAVYNVRIAEHAVIFRAIADVGYCCMLFELVFDETIITTGIERTRLYPDHVIDANDRANFIAQFVQRTIKECGLFQGSSRVECVFDVVACDGMSTTESMFCPGFNMFRITDLRATSTLIRELFPSRLTMR